MNKKVALYCGLGVVLASGTWYASWKYKEMRAEMKRQEIQLQKLKAARWRRRLFWLKVGSACLGVGGVVYMARKVSNSIRSAVLS
mgnify:CR=1 FL=1